MRSYICEDVKQCKQIINYEITQGGNHTVVVFLPKRVEDLADKLNKLPLAGWGVAYINTPPYKKTKKANGKTYYAHPVSITCPFNERQVKHFRGRLKKATAEIKLLGSDVQKVIAITKYISDHVKYENHRYNMFAYSALVSGKAVCAGYSRLFRTMCAECGIKAVLVDGMLGDVKHEWNKVFLHGKWVKIDVTRLDSLRSILERV